MDKLRELVSTKKKESESQFQGKKYARRTELESARLKRVREQEEEERNRKEALRRRNVGETASDVPTDQRGKESHEAEMEIPEDIKSLSLEEVRRRLRVLGEPIKLFGEGDDDVFRRLAVAERCIALADEAEGGQQANLHATFQRQNKDKMKILEPVEAEERVEAATVVGEEERGLMAAFQQAADALAEKNMSAEELVEKRVRKWMADWSEELSHRSVEDKMSASGKQADIRYRETQEYFRPLYFRLKHKNLDPQLLAGIKLITDAIKDRNYLHAYKIYMGVAIGNSPWPIGVTQVGLHERASREKISFKYASGSAHIMNDEATRKIIQALKRLMTFCQRRYPTVPSRSVDFDGVTNAVGDQVTNKAALLQAVERGEEVAIGQAPTLFDDNGAKIPEKWDSVIRDEVRRIETDTAPRTNRPGMQN